MINLSTISHSWGLSSTLAKSIIQKKNREDEGKEEEKEKGKEKEILKKEVEKKKIIQKKPIEKTFIDLNLEEYMFWQLSIWDIKEREKERFQSPGLRELWVLSPWESSVLKFINIMEALEHY